ncbi:MAG: hypothetical protein ABSA26_07370 [Thermoguttaceae bacterium]|jgi:hypothetical protein
MSNINIDQIRQIAASAFYSFGTTEPIIETILLHDRCYVGRKFSTGGYEVIWLAEKNVVEVFDQEGQLKQTIIVDEKMEKAA